MIDLQDLLMDGLRRYVDELVRTHISAVDFDEIRAMVRQARKQTIQIAESTWALEYGKNSNGLYPYSGQIGRAVFHPGMTRGEKGSNRVMPESTGGEWMTVVADGKDNPVCMVTDKDGWLTYPEHIYNNRDHKNTWLDFLVDQDTFIIHHGVFSKEEIPSTTQFAATWDREDLPVKPIDYFLDKFEKRWKYYFDLPKVSGPTRRIMYKARSTRVNLIDSVPHVCYDPNDPIFNDRAVMYESFGILGEVIAKRAFLVRMTY